MFVVRLPVALPIAFVLVTLLSLVLVHRMILKSDDAQARSAAKWITAGTGAWLVLQAALSLAGVYYTQLDVMPPRILLFSVLPMLILIATTLVTKRGQHFIDSLPLVDMTAIHSVRVLVELVLWWLFLKGAVPQVMTFEGKNFDVIAGMTAPFVAWLGIRRGKLGVMAAIVWNIACLGLLFNIVIIAVLSTPTPLQNMAFSQPNVAVLIFPFSWLPAYIVPVVLFCHLASIRKLLIRSGRS